MASINSVATKPATPVSTKVRRLGVAIAIVVALYSGGWFYGAGQLESWLKAEIGQSEATGRSARCPDLAVGGFPFLIGVTCASTALSDSAAGIDIETGALRTAARIYDPGSAVIEIDGPVRLSSASAGIGVTGTWQSLRASLAAGFDGLKRASAEGRDIALTLSSDQAIAALDLSVARPEFHMRANGADLDLAILAEKLSLSVRDGAALLPDLSTSADVVLTGKAGLLSGQPFGSKAFSGVLRSFKIDMGKDIYGEMSGPFSVDAEGYLSGEMTMTLENIDGWERVLNGLFPEGQGTVSGMAELLRGLKKDKPSVTVKLVVNEGTITMSMIPIGHIPPF